MNKILQNYARSYLKENLKLLSEGHQHRFKQMYSHNNIELPIEDVVDQMDTDKLDWAMQQVQTSLNKIILAGNF